MKLKYTKNEDHRCAFCGHVMKRDYLHVTRKGGRPPAFTFENEPNIIETCNNDICPQFNKPMKVEILEADEG